MPDERTIPCLPCRDVDEIVDFYAALGFRKTYRQLKPNPYVVVERGAIAIHFFGMPDFDPAQSYSTCLVASPDPDGLYRAFAEGLRGKFGKLPVSGTPRITRPQKRNNAIASFSVIDPGGNWIRVSHLKPPKDAVEPEPTGLARVLKNAIRLGDSHGDHASAAKLLDTTLAKPAADVERLPLLVYRVEVAMAMDDRATALATLAAARAASLTPADRETAAESLARLDELERDLRSADGSRQDSD